MKTLSFKIILVILTFISCNQASNEVPKKEDDKLNFQTRPMPNPNWVDSGKVEININTDLEFENLLADSAILISYKGSSGEVIYEPLNSEGKWLDSIYYVKRLTKQKMKTFYNIVQNGKLLSYDNQLCCFEPLFGVIFFKKGTVIGYSSFSIKDSKIHSTFLLDNKKHSGKLNDNQTKQLKEFVESIEIK
jgi:hypothetical protein